jgi:hypothetical protein
VHVRGGDRGRERVTEDRAREKERPRGNDWRSEEDEGRRTRRSSTCGGHSRRRRAADARGASRRGNIFATTFLKELCFTPIPRTTVQSLLPKSPFASLASLAGVFATVDRGK